MMSSSPDRARSAPPRLSLCMIVRDEARCLARALRSALPCCPDLVVVDTGSCDATREVARGFGARVFDLPWGDDFSAARNFALARARGDWALILDADEALGPAAPEALQALVERPAADAYRVMTRNYSGAQALEGWRPCARGEEGMARGAPGWFPSWKIRLFRRLSGVRFVNRVHELVEPAVAALRLRVADATVPVHHYGYWETDPRRLGKGDLYERLGLSKAAETGSAKSYYELGAQALGNGKPGEAARYLRRAVELRPGYADAAFALGQACETAGRPSEADDAYRQAAASAPNHWESRINRANLLWRMGRIEEAAEAYREAQRAGPESWLVHYNYGVFEAGAWGRVDRAESAFHRALELNRFHAPTYEKLAALALARGDADGARRWIEAGLSRCRPCPELTGLAERVGLFA